MSTTSSAEEPASASVYEILIVAALAGAAYFAAGKGLLWALKALRANEFGPTARAWVLAVFTAALDLADVAIIVLAMRRLKVGTEIFHRRDWGTAAAVGLAVGVIARFVLKPQSALLLSSWSTFLDNPYRAFSTVAFGPVSESVFFCGVLYTAARRRTNSASAYGVSVLAFGLTEFFLRYDLFSGGHPLAYLQAKLVLGALFAALYVRSGSLAAPIAAHAIYNL